MKAQRRSLAKLVSSQPPPSTPSDPPLNKSEDAFVAKSVKLHRKDNDGVVLACSAKDFPSSTNLGKQEVPHGPLPSLEHDLFLEVAEAEENPIDTVGKKCWLFRAVVRPDLPAGTLSLQDEIGKQYKWLFGKLNVHPVSSFESAKVRYELEHVELSFQNQFVSRSDMLEVIQAVQNRALIVGQNIFVTGFIFTVSRMRRLSHEAKNGLVTQQTHVSFESLTFATTCLFCVSSELDNEMTDGRTALDWAIESLFTQYTMILRTKFNAAPLLRIVLFGVTRSRGHFITTACVVRGQEELLNLPHELMRQVNLLRRRFGSEEPTEASLTYSTFRPAASSNFLDAVNVVLERFGKHSVNRLLHITGHSLWVITAGKGFFSIPSVRTAELTARRIHDIGIEKCTVLCVGRPPLHAAPLFEFDGHDPDLQNQRSLKVEQNRLYYSQPNWIRCLFFDIDTSSTEGTCRAAPSFRLFDRESWYTKFGKDTPQHGSLIIPTPKDDLPDVKVGVAKFPMVTAALLGSRPRINLTRHSLHRTSGGRVGLGGIGFSGSAIGSIPRNWQINHKNTIAEPIASCVWYDTKDDPDETQELEALLDTDLRDGGMRLAMRINAPNYQWNTRISGDERFKEIFISSFFQPTSSPSSSFLKFRSSILAGRLMVDDQHELTITTQPCLSISIDRDEEIFFRVPQEFVTTCATEGADSNLPEQQNYDFECHVCSISPTWATIFAFQPVHPYTGRLLRKSNRHADTLTTNEAMEARWRYRYPVIHTEDSEWETICRCSLMPIRCPRETIVENVICFERSHYTVSHSPPGLALHEMVYQRLTQGFQLVEFTDTHASLTMGHQTHRLSVESVAEDGEMIRVDVSQHHGVWKRLWQADEKTGAVIFFRWNYLMRSLEHCSGCIFPDVGFGEKAVNWSDFDDLVLHHKKEIDWTLSRNISYVILPASPASELDPKQVHDFLDKKFSALLTVSESDKSCPHFVPSEFPSAPSDSWFSFAISETEDPSQDAKAASEAGFDVPTHQVQLLQPLNVDEFAQLHRRRFSPAVGVQPPMLAQHRGLYLNVSLGAVLHPRCAYPVRASWTICTGSVVSDWDAKLRVNAPFFGLQVVRVPLSGFGSLGQLELLPVARLEWKTIPRSPEFVFTWLLDNGYAPERIPIGHQTRFFHRSGIAIVIATRTSIFWGENSMQPTGTAHHVALYREFVQACFSHESLLDEPEVNEVSPELAVDVVGATSSF